MDYPQALVEKVARRLAIWNDDEDPVKGVIWQPYIGDAAAALDALGLRAVFRVAWDGEPSMSGRPHVRSVGTEFHARAVASSALNVLPRSNARPNVRIEERFVTQWEESRD